MNERKKLGRQTVKLKKGCSDMLLSAFSTLAEKKANSLCSCFMYEPNIPKKLRRK